MNKKFSAAAWADDAHADDTASSQSNPVLEKIKVILKSTDPAKWSRATNRLHAESIYPKALDAWEQVYTLDIPTGVLVLRCSTPVESKFTRGGYHIVPRANDHFTIELRAQGWNARELIDPYYRTSQKGSAKFETLAEGQYVRELFLDIQRRFHEHTRSRQDDLGTRAMSIIESFSVGERKVSAADWNQVISEPGRSVYQAVIDGVNIEIAKVTNQDLDSFHSTFTRDKLQFRIDSTRALQELFLAVEEKSRLAQLEALSKILEPLS